MKLCRQKRPHLFLKSLYLRHFRNYEEASFSFGQNLNVIFGENAQGKTNLLEAISIVSTGRSFRTQHFSEIVKEGKKFFYIEAEILRDEVSHLVKISFEGNLKRLHLNASEFNTLIPLLGTFPSILSAPEDMDLVTDSPACRRRFLNLHLAQSDPLYVHHLTRFWRAMKQRNCLLKMKSLDTLDYWEKEMALSAEYIYRARKMFLGNIQGSFNEKTKMLTSNMEEVEIRFQPTYAPDSASYQELLKKMRNKEKDLGFTQYGPHRDDAQFLIQEKPAKTYASEGQKKTLVTALKIAEWEYLKEKTSILPFMAIDDFGGTLDGMRQASLSRYLLSLGQVFLTMPYRPEIFPDACFHHIQTR